MKTSELTGAALDWAVAKCLGLGYRHDFKYGPMCYRTPSPDGSVAWDSLPLPYSTNWSQGGPIIEREKIDLHHIGGAWTASIYAPKWHARDHEQFGPTPLIAAMRCFCCAKLGDEIDVPEELCQQQNS